MTDDDHNSSHTRFLLDLATEMEWYADRALEMSSCHRNAAGIYGNLHIFFGLPAAILASVSGVSAFAKYSVTAGITAFIVSGLTGAMSFLNPSEKQQLHFEAANALDSWATKTYLLIKRSRASIIEVAEFINRWEGLMQERDQINKQCPLIPSWARSKLLRKFMKPFSYLQQ
ncbi:hypothetical protein BC008_26200 [Mastigocoleus testarum BC008]|uniref:SMODS and SLOG-associating 2TM effector domain-containing protein n=2 Tax=Mastigocoleus TaxID=996924 RepID=A0A0V7ZPI8_9CYAN|nr:hypothetical protein BC008_25675 [Mastigocoleus testarum BC008]KST66684.1 hypothetical protein BC008_26200 [Mastigocoleus testarum BC008]